MHTAVDSRSGLKRNEEQRSNHSEGEQRGLDGVREVHDANIDSMFTSTDPLQRTYSQRIGGGRLGARRDRRGWSIPLGILQPVLACFGGLGVGGKSH